MKPEDISPFPILKTARLILRQLKAADKQQIFAIRTNELINRFIDRPKTISVKEAGNFITNINDGISTADWLYWGITLKGTDSVVGTICIWNISAKNDTAEIGFELLPVYQGKGYAYEALQKTIEFGFNIVKLDTLVAYTHKDNLGSTKLLEKFNFHRAAKNETNLSELIFQLTKKDFPGMHNK